MNEELKKQFESNSSDELFYYFKFDGAMDFNKKIPAGIILHERNYDNQILISEKAKLKESIEQRIKEFEDKSSFEKKARKEQKKNLINSIIYTVVLVSFYVFWYFDLPERKVVLKYFLIAGAVIFPLLMTYRILTFKKSIKYEIKQAEKDYIIQKRKLEMINMEWKFD